MKQSGSSQDVGAPSASSDSATVEGVPEIIVSAHVVDRYRKRALDCDDRRPFLAVADEIAASVGEALSRGAVLNHKPKAFRLYRESRRQLPPGSRFVMCGDTVGFIIRQASNGDQVVTTMLSRTGGTPGDKGRGGGGS